MTHWNYRIVRDGGYLMVHEVYYEGGEIVGWVEEAVSPAGEALADLTGDLANIRKALDLPVLDRSELPA